MKRQFSVLVPDVRDAGFVPGDAAAHRAAAALADRADAPTIGALLDVLTLLERVGGQFHVTALRMQQDGSEDYETVGIGFNYETRDARLKVAGAPGEVAGIPVSEMSGPAPEVEVEESTQGEDVCAICGRRDAAERPDDPPCECQEDPDAPKHPDQPAQE